MYKNRPLVRCGDQIYYGNMTDKFIVQLTIISTKKIGEHDVPDSVLVQLLYTDPDIKGKGKVKRSTIRQGMNDAMDYAVAWLNQSNA